MARAWAYWHRADGNLSHEIVMNRIQCTREVIFEH